MNDYKNKIENKFNKIKVIYVKNYRTPVKFICEKHGYKERRLDHLLETGCNSCNIEDSIKKEEKMFIHKSIKLYDYLYDYSNLNYINSKTNVNIGCKKHGVFKQLPNNHLSGSGCKYCNHIQHKDDVLIKLNGLYKCDNINFIIPDIVSYETDIKCYCSEHGWFDKKLKLLYMGHGCNFCTNGYSKGEYKICKILSENNIIFRREKTFDGCSDKYKLRFDFYIEDYNMLIEFNGIQHYKPVDYFGGYEGYIKTINHDEIKRRWVCENVYKLIIIKYTDIDNINNIITNII